MYPFTSWKDVGADIYPHDFALHCGISKDFKRTGLDFSSWKWTYHWFPWVIFEVLTSWVSDLKNVGIHSFYPEHINMLSYTQILTRKKQL